jgi:hypothetical protein
MNHCASERGPPLQAAGQTINPMLGMLCKTKVPEATSHGARSIDCRHACKACRRFKVGNNTQR